MRTPSALTTLTPLATLQELDPKNPESYFNRGTVYSVGGENEAAIADFTRAINVDETYAPALRNRALDYRRVKKYIEAQQDYHTLHLLTGRLSANQEAEQEEEKIESAEIFGHGSKDLYDKNAELTYLHHALFTGE